jgi:L-arabinokinase
MGYSIIAHMEGVSRCELRSARESGDRSNLPYKGYLANIQPSVFEAKYRKHLPAKIRGKDFAKEYGKSIDAITKPETHAKYAVRPCVTHPIYENSRVRTFSLLLEALNREDVSARSRRDHLEALGEMMYQAHASYTACQIGNEATDALVNAARVAGPDSGVYGAKITGGGSGGSVCVLCDGRKGIATAKAIAKEVAGAHGHEPLLFIGSSDGAWRTKTRRIRV